MTKTSTLNNYTESFAASSSEDCQIVESIQLRDPSAMAQLYDEYGNLLYSVILRCVANRATAEDLVQETFLQAWNRIHTFDPDRGRLRGWLVAIARNKSIDHLRSLRHQPMGATVQLDDLERARQPCERETEVDRLGRRCWVTAALAQLNPDQIAVLELTYFQGFTQTEIAHRLRKPLGTVKSLVRSSLKVIRTMVHDGASQQTGARQQVVAPISNTSR